MSNHSIHHLPESDEPGTSSAPVAPSDAGEIVTARVDVAPLGPPRDEVSGATKAPKNETKEDYATQTKVPLLEAVRKSIPADSILRRTRSRYHWHPYFNPSPYQNSAQVYLLSNENQAHGPASLTPEHIWTQLDEMGTKHAVLLVDTVDDKWCEALCARYPQSINERFLLSHILGITLPIKSTYESPAQYLCRVLKEHKVAVASAISKLHADLQSLDAAMPGRFESPQGHSGFHLNVWLDTTSGSHDLDKILYGGCVIETFDRWGAAVLVKSNGFVSCCQLTKSLHLVLFTHDYAWLSWSNLTLCICPVIVGGQSEKDVEFEADIRVPLKISPNSPSTGTQVVQVIKRHWPVFNWRIASKDHDYMQHTSLDQSLLDSSLLATLLIAILLESELEAEEENMRSLAYPEQVDDTQGHFAALKGMDQLRKFTRKKMRFFDKALPRGDHHLQAMRSEPAMDDQSNATKSASVTQLVDNTIDLLQARLDDIKEDLSEEFQVAIGAVQVQDAKEMREQTRITARQTTWTVALTVIAAIYLPMTLVTGIFGMNITEITLENTAPNAWWAFGAWAVVFAVTLGGVLVYVLMRKSRARKRADLEANHKRD
ncbi:hypothetical protein Q7P37_011649 [Cladosporium fusiforme]